MVINLPVVFTAWRGATDADVTLQRASVSFRPSASSPHRLDEVPVRCCRRLTPIHRRSQRLITLFVFNRPNRNDESERYISCGLANRRLARCRCAWQRLLFGRIRRHICQPQCCTCDEPIPSLFGRVSRTIRSLRIDVDPPSSSPPRRIQTSGKSAQLF
jgi:hypothetical protein